MPPFLVIARLTIQESSRRRLLLALLVLTLLVVGFSAWGFNKITTVTRSDGTPLPPDQVALLTSQLLIVITFMFSGVLALSAAVVAGPLISAEVESGLLLSMLARPVRRSEVVIGKWLGLAVLVAIYAAFAGTLELAAVDWATGYMPPHPVELLMYVAAEGLILLSLGLLLSTRLSGITAGVIALAAWLIAWIAGVVGDIGTGLQNQALENVGIVSHLLLPSDGLWRGAIYAMEPDTFIAAMRGADAEHRELPPPRNLNTPRLPAVAGFWCANCPRAPALADFGHALTDSVVVRAAALDACFHGAQGSRAAEIAARPFHGGRGQARGSQPVASRGSELDANRAVDLPVGRSERRADAPTRGREAAAPQWGGILRPYGGMAAWDRRRSLQPHRSDGL
ncbi:MAG: hypothetical protein AUH27_03405 [Chloroflexi bacterium 13_1_40CM_66_19]|nr:MAG: hypothetical protein AUH27_03405 [Chloroflexi bacterium 13_1_40CM_66_19]